MKIKYNDGGRLEAGFQGRTGDCVVRAIAIASGLPYQKVYDDVFELNRSIGKIKASPSNGSSKKAYAGYLASLGFVWVPTMKFGQGCRVHLKAEELPKGNLIVRVSKHLVAVIDGVINDTFDCSRGGTRCVYGYYVKP